MFQKYEMSQVLTPIGSSQLNLTASPRKEEEEEGTAQILHSFPGKEREGNEGDENGWPPSDLNSFPFKEPYPAPT